MAKRKTTTKSRRRVRRRKSGMGRYVRSKVRKTYRRRTRTSQWARITSRKIGANLNPDTMFIKLKYLNYYIVNPAAQLYKLQSIGINTPMKPDTGVALYPLGTTGYKTLYNYITCYSSKIQVTYENMQTTANAGILALIPSYPNSLPTSSINAVGDIYNALELPMVAWKRFGQINTDRSIRTITAYCSMKKLIGKSIVSTDSNFSTQFLNNSSPTNQGWWNIYIGTDNAYALGSLFVKVTYYCRVWDRAQVFV